MGLIKVNAELELRIKNSILLAIETHEQTMLSTMSLYGDDYKTYMEGFGEGLANIAAITVLKVLGLNPVFENLHDV
jgi:hypothetical protein